MPPINNAVRRFSDQPLALSPPDDGAGGHDASLGALPVWDFSGLYPEPAVPKLDADFAAARDEALAFAADYEGKLAGLDGDALNRAVERYEQLQERLNRALTYVYLRYAQQVADPDRAKALGDAQTHANDITTPLVFFSLELNRIEDAALEAKLAESPGLARYKPWIDRVRAFRPHQLSDELEKFLHDQSVVGASAWVRLFDETFARLTFDLTIDGQTQSLGLEPTLTLMMDPSRDKRAAAGAALSSVFTQNAPLVARIANTLTKEKEVEDRWRSYDSPQAERHLSNQVEAEVVQALRDAVVEGYPRTSHRYYAMKARWLGLDKLEYWDRNAPLPDVEDRKIPWTEARETVLGAYADFAPEMAEIAQRFFDSDWIDAPAAKGKASGAFAHPATCSAHPFVMLNYLGKTRDVMTLAHELGHGVHQVLAAEQGELLSRTPLTLAETASVFGEMLTFRRLLAAETDPRNRKSLLARKVEDMINTVVRQISFYDFESRLHAARREGELTVEAIGEIWLAVSRESLGPAFTFADGYQNFWTYVSHFFHAPFYVYAYAFGDGLVNALYGVYEEERRSGAQGFEARYFALLSAGGTKDHRELLAPFGLDASDPSFWRKGLDVIEAMIDELERMEA